MAEDTSATPLDMSFLDAVPHTYRLLASGGIAGCVAKTMTAPLSRLTILFQVNSALHVGGRPQYASGLLPALRKVMREEGFWAFWKGNGTSVLHRFPYAGINFYCYEKFKEALGDGSPRNETPFTRLVAGACAGGVACSACYPLDLIRTRLTIQDEGPHKEYRSITHAFRKIAAVEGMGGLYRGLGTTLMVAVPNLAISYCIYGTMKEFIFHYKYPTRDVMEATLEEPHFVESLVCGATSGICSSLITYPMDVIRRRLQILGVHPGCHRPGESVGPWNELRTIVRNEGATGLYRGLVPELLKVTPMVGCTFTTYELMKDVLGV
ncbi:mitochondrial carrier family [Nannochloropsis oceanica]